MLNSGDIVVVIVNWNAGRQLLDCVESVLSHGHDLVSTIVVVDNGSSDGSEALVEGMPKIKLVRAGSNLGFGKACNLGAAGVESKFLLFLNPDAKIFANTLECALGFMTCPENDYVGICGVKLLDEHEHVARSCARFPTPGGLLASSLGLDRVFPSVGHFMHEWDHLNTRIVDHVIGAFFLVRASVFTRLGGFDERFFVYLEDLDFSKRANAEGWSSIYLAEAQAFHAGGGTSRQVKARRLFYSLRSRILYAYKHFGFAGGGTVLFATMCIEPISRTVLGLARGSIGAVTETRSAYAMLLRWLPQWWFRGKTR
ncbi:glycosyltransferase [Aromatoleum toluvorans]|uniref:Glycosyltransferase n=1 Tax=Aromatoleum toluvorans TaxID=92002 RepID=A0ABX1Q2U3_9RHOO|nr:glycosyltransferase [Aromatoleum toluvorans]